MDEDDPKQIRVRLEGIDAPESGQPWGKRATQYLSDPVHGETVEVLSIGEDLYGRLLGAGSTSARMISAWTTPL